MSNIDPNASLSMEPIARPPQVDHQDSSDPFLDDFLKDCIVFKSEKKPLPERSLNELKVEVIPSTKSPQPSFRNGYLNRFVTALGHISDTAIDVVHDESLKGKVNLSQRVEQVPKYAKKAAHLFLSIGLGVNEKFEKLDLSKRTSEEVNQAINWLTTNENAEIKGQTDTLVATLRTIKLDVHVEEHRETFIEWLLSEPEKRPLLLHHNHKQAKECLVQLVNHLLSMKAEQLATRFTAELGDKLPSTIQKFLKDQIGYVFHIEATKAGTIIDSLNYDWTSFVDKTVTQLRDFVVGTNESLNAKDKARRACKEGSESELDKTTDREMREAYVSKGKPHSITIDSKNELNKGHVIEEQKHRAKGEYKWFTENVNKLVDILFAPDIHTIEKNINNPQEVRSLDRQSVDFWMDQIDLPEPLRPIYEQSKKLANELIDPKLLTFLKSIPAWLGADIQELIISRIKSFVVKIIVTEVLEKLDAFTHPDKIEELLALRVLPAVQPVLAKFIIKHEIGEVLKVYDAKKPSPAFIELSKALYNYHVQDDIDKNPEELTKLLMLILSKEVPGIKFDIPTREKIFISLIKELNEKMKGIQKTTTFNVFMADLHQIYKKVEDNSAIENMKHSLPNALYSIKDIAHGFYHRLSLKKNEQSSEPYNKLYQEFKLKVRKSLSSADSKIIGDLDIDACASRYFEDFNAHLEALKKKHKEFNKLTVEEFFKNYFAARKTAAENLEVYSELFKEVVQMTTFNGLLKTASLIGGPVYRAIVDAFAKDIRSSPEFLINLLAEELPDALDAPTLFDLIYSESTGPKGPLRSELDRLDTKSAEMAEAIAKHPLTNQKKNVDLLNTSHVGPVSKERYELDQLQIKAHDNAEAIANHPLTLQRKEFDAAMLKTAQLAQRLISQKVKGASYEGVVARMVGTPEGLAQNITQVYRKLLGSQFRIKDIIYKILDLAVPTLFGKWKALTP